MYISKARFRGDNYAQFYISGHRCRYSWFNHSFDYFSNKASWKNWVSLIITILLILWFFGGFFIALKKRKVVAAFSALILFVIYIFAVYVYYAWPHPELFEKWHRILISVYSGVIAASLILIIRSSPRKN